MKKNEEDMQIRFAKKSKKEKGNHKAFIEITKRKGKNFGRKPNPYIGLKKVTFGILEGKSRNSLMKRIFSNRSSTVKMKHGKMY